ncbi:MAG TPA: Fic family protein [Candidatus Kapabacteria bacterium]
MKNQTGKYHVPSQESEILPNLLGLTTSQDIQREEFEGVLLATSIIVNEVSDETVFDLGFIYRIHTLAFGELYEFAGKLRTVNVSKDGFVFPAAMYLEETMLTFERTMLLTLDKSYGDKDEALNMIAQIHAELLFIHPFSEGNGRVARILADAMATKYGMPLWNFDPIYKSRMDEYVLAVQGAAASDYEPMKELFRSLG